MLCHRISYNRPTYICVCKTEWNHSVYLRVQHYKAFSAKELGFTGASSWGVKPSQLRPPDRWAVCIVISSSILSHFNGDITSNCALQAVDIVNCHWLVSQCSIGGYDCRHALFSVGWKVGSVLGPSARPKLYRNIQPSTVLMTPKSY